MRPDPLPDVSARDGRPSGGVQSVVSEDFSAQYETTQPAAAGEPSAGVVCVVAIADSWRTAHCAMGAVASVPEYATSVRSTLTVPGIATRTAVPASVGVAVRT